MDTDPLQPLPQQQPVQPSPAQPLPQEPMPVPLEQATPPPPMQPTPSQQPFPPTFQEAHDEPPHNSPMKKILMVGGLLVLLILVGTVSYIMGANQSKPATVATVATPTQVPAPQPTVDPMASWRTYTASTAGYTISYPGTWHLLENETVFLSPSEIKPIDGATTAPITIGVLKNTSVEASIAQEKQAKTYTDFKDETISVGSVSARRISGKVGTGYLAGSTNVEVFIPNGTSLINISFYEAVNASMANFNQILSTFTLAQTPSVSYTCPKTEYVDCMPQIAQGTPTPRPQCEQAYLTWAKSNCPGFKGAAL